MKLIDADEAVRKIQKEIKKLQNDLKIADAKKCKSNEEEKRKHEYKERINSELVKKAEFLAFLKYDCEEVKINTKGKEQTQ